MREDYSLTFTPLSIARYSFIQLSELGHRGENEKAQTLKWQQRGFYFTALHRNERNGTAEVVLVMAK